MLLANCYKFLSEFKIQINYNEESIKNAFLKIKNYRHDKRSFIYLLYSPILKIIFFSLYVF